MILEVNRGGGFRDDGAFLERGDTTRWSDPLSLLLYHAHQSLKSPKSGILFPSINNISQHHVMRRGRQCGSCLALRFSSLSYDVAHKTSHIPLGVLYLPLLSSGSPLRHFPNRRQRIDAQQHPPISKQLITRSCPGLRPHLADITVYRHFPLMWLLHNSIPLPACFSRKGSLSFLLCWRTALSAGSRGFCQALPTGRRAPEGRGA
jgi:hypothetical protein